MVFLDVFSRLVILVIHVLSVLVAVGAVTITDYLHIVGLKNRSIEKKLLFVYPLLSQMIIGALFVIFVTGTLLVINEPHFLTSKLFQLKLFIVGIIVINGIFLHRKVFPEMKKCVEGEKGSCSKSTLFISSLCGSISIVSWYGVVILALTKMYGYSPMDFLVVYICTILFIFLIALFIENSQRTWY